MTRGEPETLEQAVQELERRKREDPLKNTYEPHQFQETAHGSRKDVTLVIGGNRTGKTWMLVAECLLYCLGRSAYAETPEAPNTVWYVVPTSDTFVDAVKPIIEELIPWKEVTGVTGQKLKRYKFENGSRLVIRSADQRQKRLVGAAVDLAAIDEPIPKAVYEEIAARTIDTGGRIVMALTPVSETQSEWLWIRDDLYLESKAGARGDVEIIHMPVADEDGKPAVPHLTQDQVDKFERLYPDPQVRAARMYGEFIVRSGLVFGSFDSDVHLIDRFEIPPNWHEWLVCDPQYHRFAVLHFAADEEGCYYVVNEYFSQDETLRHRAKRIKGMIGLDRERDLPMYVDYANPQDITELNYHFGQIGAPIGAMPLEETKRVEKMILRTHSLLEPHPDRTYHRRTGMGDVHGAPRLLFFSDLSSTWDAEGRQMRQSRLLWELSRLTWGKKGKPDKDSAGGADCTDCLIYGCSAIKSGRPEKDQKNWTQGLSERDVVIWESIERQDEMQERGIEYPS